MSKLVVNDVFDELFGENKRLIEEFIFATKCLNVLTKFKNFVDLVFDKIKTNLDPNIVKVYEELHKEVDQTWSSYHCFENKSSPDHKADDISSDTELIEVSPDIFTSDQSMDAMTETNDSFNSNTIQTNNEIQSNSQIIPINESNNENIIKRENIPINEINCNQINDQSIDLRNVFKMKAKNNDNVFKCCFVGCEKAFKTKQKLIGHQKRIHSGKWFTCERPKCQYKTRTKFLLKSHQKSHEITDKLMKSQSFFCDFKGCGRQFTNSADLMRHNSIHKIMKPFICENNSCNQKFLSKNTLKAHIKESHLTTDQTFRCDLKSCNKVFENYELLANHKSTHKANKPFKCQQIDCDYRAKNLTTLKNHGINAHKIDRPFRCAVDGCLFSGKTKSGLNFHVKNVHLSQSSYVCERNDCGKAFKTKGGLTSHQKNFHSELIFECNWSGCEFFTKNEICLKSHIKNHENERQFACDWNGCDKRFNFKHQLTIHIRTHTKEKRYACKESGCNYRCIFGGNLRKHMRVHQK